ncbi:MAG: hypothetical protein ACFCUG_12015 [Thiotrichales bacterium]
MDSEIGMGARFLERLVRHARGLAWLMLALMALLVVADLLIPTGYGRFPWDSIGGFGALYGLVSCGLIVGVSKWLGYAFLYRPEDYYDEDPPAQATGQGVSDESEGDHG